MIHFIFILVMLKEVNLVKIKMFDHNIKRIPQILPVICWFAVIIPSKSQVGNILSPEIHLDFADGIEVPWTEFKHALPAYIT